MPTLKIEQNCSSDIDMKVSIYALTMLDMSLKTYSKCGNDPLTSALSSMAKGDSFPLTELNII
jgi:hypothetical protein